MSNFFMNTWLLIYKVVTNYIASVPFTDNLTNHMMIWTVCRQFWVNFRYYSLKEPLFNRYNKDQTSNEGRKMEEVTSQNDSHEEINKPTHISNNLSSCTDLIFNS